MTWNISEGDHLILSNADNTLYHIEGKDLVPKYLLYAARGETL